MDAPQSSQPSPAPPRLIWALLLVSGLLHAAVLVFWPFAPPAGIAGGGVLQVRLAAGKTAPQANSGVQPAGGRRPQDRAGEAAEESRTETGLPPGAGLTAEADQSAQPARKTVLRQKQAMRKRPPSRLPVRNRDQAPDDLQTKRRQGSEPPGRKQPVPQPVTAGSEEPGKGAPEPTPSPVAGESPENPGSRTAAAPVAGERSGTGGNASELIQAALRNAMLPHFDYPLLARRRGWEGRVKIRLLVQPDGGLTDMVVLESSGYQVLDQAALEDLRQVDRLPQATAWLDGRQLDVVLPVLYRFR